MAKVHLATYRSATDKDACNSLAGLTAANQVVVSDDTNDFYTGSPCDLGRKVYESDVYTGSYSEILVLDPSDNCIKRNTKPASIVYNEANLQPWIAEKVQDKTIGSATTLVCLAELTIPTFAVDVNLFVRWTTLWRPTINGYCRWYPHYGDPVTSGGTGNNYLPSPKIGIVGMDPVGKQSSSMCRHIPFAAGRVGQTLAIIADFSEGGLVTGIITAYAMKL